MKDVLESSIALQSKEWMKDALLKLMVSSQYNQITVSEIASEAKLNRRTFYRHFKTKDDILSFYFESICRDYIELLKQEKTLFLPNITRVFFTFCTSHLDFLRLLEKNNLLYMLLEKLNEYLPYIYNLFKGERNEYTDTDELKYALAFSVGGYWNTLRLWLRGGMDKNPEELSKILEKALRINVE